jgi:hypothetical protein
MATRKGKPPVVIETKPRDEPVKTPRKNSNWDVVKNLLPRIVHIKKNNSLPPLELTNNGHANQAPLPNINT